MARSIDYLTTSQSIEGRSGFPDFEMLDVNTASALNKNISYVHFRRRASVEEQRAQKYERFSRVRQMGYIAQGLSDLIQYTLT